jgi:hypothetical protein
MRYRVKSLAEDAQRAERDIANIREDLRSRSNTRGDDFTMTVQKETFTDRTKAGWALVFLAAALNPFQSTKPIGTIAGFPITVERLDTRTTLKIHGKHVYEANVSDNALGTISSVEHALGSLEDRLHDRETDLKQYRRQSDDLAKQLNYPFEHEDKLTVAAKRQQEIVSALDITRNQASVKIGEMAGQAMDSIDETFQQTIRTGRMNAAAAVV